MRALRIRVTGVVQGVGFRPFVYRLARAHAVSGWVRNDPGGVTIQAEAEAAVLERFLTDVRSQAPPAAHIAGLTVEDEAPTRATGFEIVASGSSGAPTTRVSPDLAVCASCVLELFDRTDRRYRYPYINCTNCGPRYSIVEGLPYDRPMTTMRDWPMCSDCEREYHDPNDRRFHAQPIACPACGPNYLLRHDGHDTDWPAALPATVQLLRSGAIVALKGIGGYHLACDAANEASVEALRTRKYRKERPFALMVRDMERARELAVLEEEGEAELVSLPRPIVLAEAMAVLPGVAPHNRELGIMLPYAPLHHLLFEAGAPPVLVMTSANRSSEPIAYRDEDALHSLAGIADAFLMGARAIARRVDDSVVRAVGGAPSILRRSRGLAPQAVAAIPVREPILALGGDLKNALTLVVDGQAFGSQHIGDLEHLSAAEAFRATARDLCALYGVAPEDVTVVHDAHPEYVSSGFAEEFGGRRRVAVQHHRAHIASVLAERAAWAAPVIGFAFDGTGYGDDASIWGGEVFSGSLTAGLVRVAHLRRTMLPGGDAAARFPVQAAAGFLYDVAGSERLDESPFCFPVRYERARRVLRSGVRAFPTTSVGRLFDTVAGLCGFTREMTFEGQAAMWLEHLATGAGGTVQPYDLPLRDGELDYRPLLTAAIADRRAGRDPAAVAAAFHGAVAAAIVHLAQAYPTSRVVASGGVFQNRFLTDMLRDALGERLWLNHVVPANDGGISLGQAALAAFEQRAMRPLAG